MIDGRAALTRRRDRQSLAQLDRSGRLRIIKLARNQNARRLARVATQRQRHSHEHPAGCENRIAPVAQCQEPTIDSTSLARPLECRIAAGLEALYRATKLEESAWMVRARAVRDVAML